MPKIGMDLYGRGTVINGSQLHPSPEWAPAGHQTGIEESMKRMDLSGREIYPERPGLPDCVYYMRTGSCAYGTKCRYNHPRDRSSVGAVRNEGGEYPLRVGEPSCQFYLRTGTCKFAASCKFDHPRLAGGSLINVQLNSYGYPLRPDEKECSYYLKTGQCKFGIVCEFHHPQPSDDTSMPESARPINQRFQSPSYEAASTNHREARPALVPSSYVPNAYGTMLLPVPNWSPYSGPVRPLLSSGARASVGANPLYGIAKLPSTAPAHAGFYPPLLPSASPNQTEKVFPSRPGQPECEYYKKTGNCKFGLSCKYNHPLPWKTNYVLSSAGLPLRPGVQPCTFYLQTGSCKFGHACKFDHPVVGMTETTTVRYDSPSALALTNVRVAPLISYPQLHPLHLSDPKLDNPYLSPELS